MASASHLLVMVASSLHSAQAATPSRSTTTLITLRPPEEGLARLEQFALAAATPSSGHYGEALSQHELADYVGSSDTTIGEVQAALMGAHGCQLRWLAPSRDVLFFDSCSQESSLNDLRTAHPAIVVADSVQDVLSVRADATQPQALERKTLSSRGSRNNAAAAAAAVSVKGNFDPTAECSNDTTVTPGVMHALYQLPSAFAPCPENPQGQAVAMNGWDNVSASDLQVFFHKFAPELVNQTVAKVYGSDLSSTDIESKLDVQWSMSMGPFVPTSFFSGAMNNFTNWMAAVNRLATPPLVHSVSADWVLTAEQREQWDFELTKAAARRLTVMVASGDSGESCDIFSGRLSFTSPSSPWITVVGGTQLSCDPTAAAAQEVAWNDSGGGFSENYATPDWQRDAVARYLNNTPADKMPPLDLFNSTGRGMPDVALLANNTAVVDGGEVEIGAGTSISSPAFAGIISLLNNARLAAGKQPLGALGPFLYANPEAFTDITSGYTGDPVPGRCPGYYAVQGWDPTTGLGSPVFPKLLEAALALP